MAWRKENKSPNDVNGFLDQGVFFEGHLEFSGTLRVDGSIKGTVKTDDHLLIGENGILEAEIFAGTITINGKVTGVVHAKDKVQIHRKGRVSGEIYTPVLEIEPGAILDGKTFMSQSTGVAVSIDATDRGVAQKA
jgi:cytoskeletal protein CcmA (bactofilin family)